jgi:disulfide bond formation protein DsbB
VCVEVNWLLLGLSMPEWTLLGFLGPAIGGFVRNWLRER